jgi:hypothetical protein
MLMRHDPKLVEAVDLDVVDVGDRGPAERYALIDDADGLFQIDEATGVIATAPHHPDAAALGAIHPVRVRLTRANGEIYESCFHLAIAAPLPCAVLADGSDPLAPYWPPAPRASRQLAVDDGAAFGAGLLRAQDALDWPRDAALLTSQAHIAPAPHGAVWSLV